MSSSLISWPLPNLPVKNARVILASQGVRIWTAECRLESSGDVFQLSCHDPTTMENLRHQQRVAFTILDTEPVGKVQGSGIAQLSGSDGPGISLEPYRISATGDTYELKLNGWTKASEVAVPDTSKWAFWYQAFRLVTFPLSALAVLTGGAAAFAQGNLSSLSNLLLLALTLIGAVCAHAGANAMADYFDFKKGVDRSRALSSHLGALAQERVEPEMILIAAFALLLVTALIGLILVQLVGWRLLIFGLAGLLGAFFYTGRPISYKYRALGEVFSGTMMGPVMVMGSYYVQTQSWNWAVFLISLALGMIVSSVSLANNLRDLPDDKIAGILTLPMKLGVSASKKLYYFLIFGPYPVAAAAILFDRTFWPVALIILSLPKAIKAFGDLHKTTDDLQDIRQKSRTTPYPLNSIRLHARFGELTAIALTCAGLIRIIW